MPGTLLGRKIGMTRYFTEDGKSIPVTVLECGPCVVTQVKTTETDGYSAIQVGFEEVRPKRSTMPIIGHDGKAGSGPLRAHRELRVDSDDDATAFELGQKLTVSEFEGVMFVDVVGTSKGKGFQGVMKRHNFKGQLASHGVERKHRSAGSIGGHSANLGTGPKIKKGKRMAGQMGNDRVMSRSMELVSIDPERNLMLVKGAVPGASGGLVQVREACRLNRQKARRAKAG